MIERALIVGAGGWGRSVLGQMLDDPSHGKDWMIGGFLDSRPHALDGYDVGVSIVGDPMTYVPDAARNDVFICALGRPEERKKFSLPLLGRNARFIPIRARAHLAGRTHVGAGCIFEDDARFGPDCYIDDFVAVHSLTTIGHDVQIGKYAQIGAQVFVGGGVRIGELVTVHPHATILPGLAIGAGATVGAGAVVIKDVPAGATVFGNPGKIIFQKDT